MSLFSTPNDCKCTYLSSVIGQGLLTTTQLKTVLMSSDIGNKNVQMRATCIPPKLQGALRKLNRESAQHRKMHD